MNIQQELLAGHQDLIHDIKFNFYGNRFVTCSSDHKLKVWDKAEITTLNDSWKAHDAAVIKTSWAHPEFGQIIASCSFDRTVKIWEEAEQESINSGKRWLEKCKLGHAKSTIQDVKFAPNHLGLKLACCSADGVMRIYEAMDPMNPSDWTLTHDFELAQGAKEPDGQFCLSWCTSKLLPPMIAAGCGKDNNAKIFRLDQNNTWAAFESLPGHNGAVRDIAWAPNMGRTYQLIATAASDGCIRIYHLTPAKSISKNLFTVELVTKFEAHHSEVWRLDWNVTGTILSSSGDDGCVKLWKSSFMKEWKMIGIIEPDS